MSPTASILLGLHKRHIDVRGALGILALRKARDERVHLRDRRFAHLRRVVHSRVDGGVRVPARRVAAPAAVEKDVVEEAAPERVDGEDGGVADDDEQRLRAGDGDCGRRGALGVSFAEPEGTTVRTVEPARVRDKSKREARVVRE